VKEMARILGRGLEVLKEFIRKCRAAGGVPMIRTGYGGVQFTNKVVVACWGKGKEVPGGTILDIPPSMIAEFKRKVGEWKEIVA